MKIRVEKILEFHDLFPEESELDIHAVVKHYNRELLVKCAHVLSNNFDSPRIPDFANPFFSDISHKHIGNINTRIKRLQKESKKNSFVYCTQRTALELLRIVFDIAPPDYINDGKDEDFEYDIFRVILQINENLMAFKSRGNLDIATLTYFSFLISNDFLNFNLQTFLLNQIYCYLSLSQFLCTDLRCHKAKQMLYDKCGITSMHQYARTWLALFSFAYNYIQKGIKQCPILDLDKLSYDEQFIVTSVLDHLSLPIETQISYTSRDYKDRENNVDYRCFRAHPLIKISQRQYLIYSFPILLERLYYGMFWDIKDAFNDSFHFYNTEFVERRLFQTQIVENLDLEKSSFFYPTLDLISSNILTEDSNQPDYYIREQDMIVLFECKAIRINGTIKDKADISELLKILKGKLYFSDFNIDKTRKNKKPDKVGVTQLVHLMEMIDKDTFKWDTEIPDEVAYYPVIVLEDSRLVKPGITYLINEWYKPLVKEKLPDQMCQPIIVMSINTLVIYSEVFRKNGYHKIFDEFFKSTVCYSGIEWQITYLADFDSFMSVRYKQSKYKLQKRYMEALHLLQR